MESLCKGPCRQEARLTDALWRGNGLGVSRQQKGGRGLERGKETGETGEEVGEKSKLRHMCLAGAWN